MDLHFEQKSEDQITLAFLNDASYFDHATDDNNPHILLNLPRDR